MAVQAEELEHRLYDFIYSYLGQDGVFVMRLVSWNSGVALTAELLTILYFKFRELKAKHKTALREAKNEKSEPHDERLPLLESSQPSRDLPD